MAIGNLILVHFDRQLTEAEFYDVMSDVTGIHSVVAKRILDPESEEDTISLIISDDDLIMFEGYCWLSWYKEHGYEDVPVYTIDEFIDVFRPDQREPMNFEDELMDLIGG